MVPVSAEGSDEGAAGDDQRRGEHQPPPHQLRLPEEDGGERDPDERLDRDERRDHGDPAAVVRLEEADVRRTEEHACGQERDPATADPLPRPNGDQHGSAEQRRRRGHCGRHRDRKSTRLNSSHGYISYAVFCLKKKKKKNKQYLLEKKQKKKLKKT